MQTLRKTGERQVGSSLSSIAPDHRKRYYLVCNQLEPGSAVVDIGSGCGYGSYILAAAGHPVYGYDISPEAVQYAREHWQHPNASFWIANAEHPESITSWGKASIAFEIVEHLNDPLPLLRAIQSETLFTSVPDETGNPWSKEKFPFHYRHYTAEQFVDLLSEAGWETTNLWYQMDKVPGNVFEARPAMAPLHGCRTIIAKAERK